MKFWRVTEGIHMNNSAEKIPVFFHTSDEFCPYMCVAIASILYNTKSFIDFYIIETGVSNFNKKLIASLKEKFSNFNINWISFEYNNIFKREYFENLNGNDKGKPWPGIHAFCTPFMPLLVDTSIDKLIYLDSDIILLDGNTSPTADTFSSEVIYLIEPSKIQLNKLLARDPKVFERNKNKKNVLNQCMLNSQDISDFEIETGLNVFSTIPPLNDQSDENKGLDEFFVKLGFYKQDASNEGKDKKGIMGLFK